MITIKGSEMAAAIKFVQGFVGRDCESVNIWYKDNHVQLSAFNNAIRASHVVRAKTVGEGTFSVSCSVLLTALAGRDELQISLQDKLVRYKAVKGRYRGEISTSPYSAIVIIPKDKKLKPTKLSKDLQSLLLAMSKYVALKSAYSDDPLLLLVRSDNERTVLAVADDYHVAKLTTKGIGNLSLDIPMDYIQQFTSLTKMDGCVVNFSYDESSLYLWTALSKIALPLIYNDKFTYEKIQQLFAGAGHPSAKAKIDVKEALGIIHNLSAMYDAGSSLAVTLKDKNMEMSLKSGYGRASDSLPVQVAYTDSQTQYWEMQNTIDVLSHASGSAKAVLSLCQQSFWLLETHVTKKTSVQYISIAVAK